MRIQELICHELNLPIINLPVPGSQSQSGANGATTEAPGSNPPKENSNENDGTADASQGTTDPGNQSQMFQDGSIYYHYRDMQRRQVEYIKKRVLLLEKGLNAEYQKEYFVSSPHYFSFDFIPLICYNLWVVAVWQMKCRVLYS